MDEQKPIPEPIETLAAATEAEWVDETVEREEAPPPTTAKNSPVCVLATSPLSSTAVARLCRRVQHTPLFGRILIGFSLFCIVVSGIEVATADVDRIRSVSALMTVLLCIGVWGIVMWVRRSRRPTVPTMWQIPRINEVYEQGAVSRSGFGTVVVPFDEVTLYGEYLDMIILHAPCGTVAWSSADLTGRDALFLQTYLRSRVPEGTYKNGGVFQGTAVQLSPLFPLPSRTECHATAETEISPRFSAWVRLKGMIERGAPLMALFAIGVSNLICGGFLFDFALLNSRWVWFGLVFLLQGLALFGLLWLEAAVDGRPAGRSLQPLRFCEDGLWLSDGRSELRLPPGTITARPTQTALMLSLPTGELPLPYSGMSDRGMIFRYFGLNG